MKITVKLGAPLSQVVGEAKAILSLADGATVADAIEELHTRYPNFGDGLRGEGLHRPLDQMLYSLFVNARHVAWEQAETTPLRDGDRLFIFLPVAGG
jgi:molybdopterin converting factor small subunit